ncbi:TnsD family Tn7-like transposition protein [Vibrio sp. TH_r3]|uniref:TnsD family Tn7-like transposition protein n=1 Tax=Vibrio sp. TH_r3 TaxID=3082084 RepID=UPI002952F724|nr:TnsD family Tn7-like transposition protein [Vibrio sp. TH_r3]MDV7105389.1 TnsD family Tn7-like transposition protein [Vibrio sp. TH_r3]
MQFPVPYEDELLSSVLARFVQRQGLNADKQALELLFGSRNIVPSSLFQGHIQLLLSHVGHLWDTSPEQIIEKHALLGVFKPFMGASRYQIQKDELIFGSKNQTLTSIGINASKLNWPRKFRYCPICLKDDIDNLGETYWRRQFQLPGISCCPIHRCLLVDSGIEIRATHRHAYIPADYERFKPTVGIGIIENNPFHVSLARQIDSLFSSSYSCHSEHHWSLYYKNLASSLSLMKGGNIDHDLIRSIIRNSWGDNWLAENGLGLEGENNWLVAMFRKHRRVFTYLHHLVAMIALLGEFVSIKEECTKVDILPDKSVKKAKYHTSKYEQRKEEYRAIWLDLMKYHESLKDIRNTREGTRVYSWLYRFDRKWHCRNLPKPLIIKHIKPRVDWGKRDLKIAKQLLSIERSTFFDLSLPRKSGAWYSKQINATNLIPDKLDKLPLCHCFLTRYQESVEEYQIRRLLCIVVDKLTHGQTIPKIYELERSAGLSKKRIREPAKQVLFLDIPRISRQAGLAGRYQINSGPGYNRSSGN